MVTSSDVWDVSVIQNHPSGKLEVPLQPEPRFIWNAPRNKKLFWPIPQSDVLRRQPSPYPDHSHSSGQCESPWPG